MDDLEHELSSCSKIIKVGDVNYSSMPDNVESTNYVNLLISYDVKILNQHATRNTSGRCVDHFASNFGFESTVNNFTVSNGISDHNLIVSQLDNLNPHKSSGFLTFSHTNYDKMRQCFEVFSRNSNILNISIYYSNIQM